MLASVRPFPLLSGSLTRRIALVALATLAGSSAALAQNPFPNDIPSFDSVSATDAYIKRERNRLNVMAAAVRAARRGRQSSQEHQYEQSRESLNHQEAWLCRMRVRAYPNDKINTSAYAAAAATRDRLTPALSGATSTTRLNSVGDGNAAFSAVIVPRGTVRWEFVGPKDFRPSYQWGFGPVTSPMIGRVNGAAFDPKNANTMYIAAPSGGIWKSVDAGLNWYSLGDSFPVHSSSSIAVHPTNTQILLAGLGDNDGGDFFGDIPGIMRSLDGGRTWTLVGNTVLKGSASVSSVTFDPDTPTIAVAALGGGSYRGGAPGGLFYSTDTGVNWTRATITPAIPVGSTADFRDLKIGAKNAAGKRFYYATNGSGANGIYRSSDNGRSWTFISAPVSGTGNGIESAPSPTDPNVIYVADGANRKVQKGVFSPATNAYTWTDITGNMANWSQTFYDFYALAVPQIVNGKLTDSLYVGTLSVNGSPGATGTWNDMTQTYSGNDTMHTDQHCMAYNPLNPNQMLVGSDGGIYLCTYDSTKKTWSFRTNLNKTLGITQLYTADWHPTKANMILGASQDNANPAALGNTASWRQVGTGDGMAGLINPTQSNIMYTTVYYQTILHTRSGYADDPIGDEITPNLFSAQFAQWWNEEAPSRAFVGHIALDPTFPHPVYLGTNYLWRWNEDRQAWDGRLGGQQLATLGNYVYGIAVAPSDPNRIYVGTTDARLWVSKDKGATWTKIADGRGGGPMPNRAITAISVHPTKPDDILVTFSGTGSTHVFRSTNAGAAQPTFIGLTGTGLATLPDVPANCIERVPGRTETGFMVGTDIGVFYTPDAGRTWQNATTPLGLPNVEVTAIKATARTGYMNISTYGRGFWRLSLNGFLNAPALTPTTTATR